MWWNFKGGKEEEGSFGSETPRDECIRQDVHATVASANGITALPAFLGV